MNPLGTWDSVPMTMYLIVINEGTLTVPGLGNAVTQLGVLSKQDIINAREQPGISYRDIQDVNGGDFLSGLKNFASKINDFLKSSKLASNLANIIPIAGPAISKSLNNLGYGCEEEGGVPVGGKRMSKAKLRKSLMER